MKNYSKVLASTTTISSVLLLSGALVASNVLAGDDEHVAASRAAVKALGGQLKEKLQTTMKASGPVEAIGVCNLEAPEIAAQVSGDQNLEVGRTSLKLRNTGNAPDEWEQAVLEAFEKRLADGEDPAKMEFSETVGTADGEAFRYMKAIPTGVVCLSCHGSDIKDEVRARLDELYPDDQAVGFKGGQIRGAFTVTKPL